MFAGARLQGGVNTYALLSLLPVRGVVGLSGGVCDMFLLLVLTVDASEVLYLEFYI